jgi:hypothetical protein
LSASGFVVTIGGRFAGPVACVRFTAGVGGAGVGAPRFTEPGTRPVFVGGNDDCTVFALMFAAGFAHAGGGRPFCVIQSAN